MSVSIHVSLDDYRETDNNFARTEMKNWDATTIAVDMVELLNRGTTTPCSKWWDQTITSPECKRTSRVCRQMQITRSVSRLDPPNDDCLLRESESGSSWDVTRYWEEIWLPSWGCRAVDCGCSFPSEGFLFGWMSWSAYEGSAMAAGT